MIFKLINIDIYTEIEIDVEIDVKIDFYVDVNMIWLKEVHSNR